MHMKHTIKRVSVIEEPWHFLGYQRTEGECWTLVGMTEAEADKCIEEYKTTGKITITIAYGQSTEVIEPTAVAKLTGDKVYYAVEYTAEGEPL